MAAGYPASLKLTYFNGRGAMEVSRSLLAAAGKFPPADYEDFRFTGAPPAVGPENLGRVPIATADGVTIGQGNAIHRYVASITGALGDDPLSAARIDNICETVRECSDFYYRLVPFGNTFDDATKAEKSRTWFETAPPAAGTRDGRYVQWFLTNLEAVVGDNGFAVGTKVSIADAYLYNRFGENDAALPGGGGAFGNAAATVEVLKGFPKVQRIVENYRNIPGVKKWLETRGPQNF